MCVVSVAIKQGISCVLSAYMCDNETDVHDIRYYACDMRWLTYVVCVKCVLLFFSRSPFCAIVEIALLLLLLSSFALSPVQKSRKREKAVIDKRVMGKEKKATVVR